MPPAEQRGDVAKPAAGDHCPVCNNGVLYLIGETADVELLQCFNCATRGGVPKHEPWVASVDPTTHTANGFQLTHDQLAAKREAGFDPEQAAARNRAAGSPDPNAAPAEQHAQHDVKPRDESPQRPNRPGFPNA